MTVHCCPHCRRTLTFRPGVRIEGLHEGDWSGCPGCGANMCVACGDAAGGHCPDCGVALVRNRSFMSWLRPHGSWRDAFDDDDLGRYVDTAQLVAHAAADVVDDLVATATARRPDFADSVAWLVARHALGSLEYLLYIPDGEYRLPLPWYANLERVARRLSARDPARWAATIDAWILVQGVSQLEPAHLGLPWPADLLDHDQAAVRDAITAQLGRVGDPRRWDPLGMYRKPRAELAADLADRKGGPCHCMGLIDALAGLANDDAAARACLLASIDNDQEYVDVRVHAACALAIDAPGDAPPAARLAGSATPMLRAAGHVLGARARADDPSPLLRYLATSRDSSLTAWCAANPELRERLWPPPRPPKPRKRSTST